MIEDLFYGKPQDSENPNHYDAEDSTEKDPHVGLKLGTINEESQIEYTPTGRHAAKDIKSF